MKKPKSKKIIKQFKEPKVILPLFLILILAGGVLYTNAGYFRGVFHMNILGGQEDTWHAPNQPNRAILQIDTDQLSGEVADTFTLINIKKTDLPEMFNCSLSETGNINIFMTPSLRGEYTEVPYNMYKKTADEAWIAVRTPKLYGNYADKTYMMVYYGAKTGSYSNNVAAYPNALFIYHFNIPKDATGKGNNPEVSGATFVDGPLAGGYTFNGTSSMRVPMDKELLNQVTEFTVIAYVKLSQFTNAGNIVDYGWGTTVGTGPTFRFGQNTTDAKLKGQFKATTTYDTGLTANALGSEYSTVALTWTKGSFARIYINGVMQVEQRTASSLLNAPFEIRDFYIGKGFKGEVNELYMFSKAKTGPEFEHFTKCFAQDGYISIVGKTTKAEVESCSPACGDGYECINKKCVELTCSPVCGTGYECIKGVCQELTCEEDCPKGTRCRDGECMPFGTITATVESKPSYLGPEEAETVSIKIKSSETETRDFTFYARLGTKRVAKEEVQLDLTTSSQEESFEIWIPSALFVYDSDVDFELKDELGNIVAAGTFTTEQKGATLGPGPIPPAEPFLTKEKKLMITIGAIALIGLLVAFVILATRKK